ncbi:hypothetical protein CC1G_07427 [Coprinopsis cinerea okayama7|uniref:Integrase core domain-containing protein n=1 Tax=Coprinopsis cinerea (strain Okayama-7 / 130 / ATCC MYA-4618 / FGSC 9003) TaxID=240176 RepID=A8NB55_COPC7|nr:hypothetical protein CC1G_07427 [Coprinopsis cinerea okayama7\|eukprot:XP_001832056.2 hypothetical protein CC1G_07427 [Coprinopsis cinerea okayama7\
MATLIFKYKGCKIANQSSNLIEDIPDLPDRLQVYVNEGVRVKDLPHAVKRDLGASISLSSIKKIMNRFDVKTTRRSGLTDLEKGLAILSVTEDDPLGRWGCRTVKEKLALKGIHVERDFAMRFRRADNAEASAAQHPRTRKRHNHGLWSSGPNEEWCLDGHEKILHSMGIAVYGIIDKFSRMELALVAVPNARDSDVPVAVYLRTVKKFGGMPLSSTSDKGTELRKLISLVGNMRAKYQPHITEAQVPSHIAVSSPDNITRERGWRPIWNNDLSNILFFYQTGKEDSGYVDNDDFHISLARWIWARIVQARLDQLLLEHQTHRIRGQRRTLLPTDARRIDLFTDPETYGGYNQLIQVPSEDIDRLLSEYDRPDLFQFVSDDMEILFTDLHKSIGSPIFTAATGWETFRCMLTAYIARVP